MVWVDIERVDMVNEINDSYYVYFEIFGHIKRALVTKKVLKYIKADEIKEGDMIYVVKTFSKTNKPIYMIKDVKR